MEDPVSDYEAKVVLLYSGTAIVLLSLSAYQLYLKSIFTCIKDTCLITSVFTILLMSCDILLRLLTVMVYLTSSSKAYDNVASVFNTAFTMNMSSIIVFGILTLLLVTVFSFGMSTSKNPFYILWDYNIFVYIPCILSSLLLLKILNFSDWYVTENTIISSMKGLDYGTGMAYSYYYGYLRIVLPSTGTNTKGLQEKIENFEANHNVTIPIKKLFILIPSSSHIPPDLKEASYQWMESTVILEDEIRDRAGVKNRTYRNNVYKIYPDGKTFNSSPLYVVVEGATPMLTYYEVQTHMHPESSIYKKYHKKIVFAFYTKLKKLLEDDLEVRHLCELIYFDDYDSNGKRVNVAKIILERMHKLQHRD